MADYRAACCCGRLTVRCSEEPLRISICHCHQCQRRTGSAFSVNLRFADKAVTVAGPSQAFVRRGDSGKNLTFHFCPSCGSTLWWTLEAVPGVVAVAGGSFITSQVPPPRVSVYESCMAPWVRLPDSVTEHHA
jgi:hypothetical protein